MIIKDKIKNKKSTLAKLLVCGFAVIFLWFIIHTVVITIEGLRDNIGSTDAAVVLGNKVELNGEPSERLKGRLDKAIELYEKGYFEHIIVSGGNGKEGFNEAAVMKEYLVDKGVTGSHIILDQEGYNTYSTALNTKEIMADRGFASITIITQFYHISRTELAFRKAGIDNISSAHGEYYELRDLYSLFREFFAYYKYLLI